MNPNRNADPNFNSALNRTCPIPRFSALTPSGFGADRPLFNPDEPPYEVERESVRQSSQMIPCAKASFAASSKPTCAELLQRAYVIYTVRAAAPWCNRLDASKSVLAWAAGL